MANSDFTQLIQESDPVVKKTLAKRSEFLLIRADKILTLSSLCNGFDVAESFGWSVRAIKMSVSCKVHSKF